MLEFKKVRDEVRIIQKKMLDSNRKTFCFTAEYKLKYRFLEAAYENLQVEYDAYRDIRELESIII